MFWTIFSLIGYIASAIALAISCWTHNVGLLIINAICLPLNTMLLVFNSHDYRRTR